MKKSGGFNRSVLRHSLFVSCFPTRGPSFVIRRRPWALLKSHHVALDVLATNNDERNTGRKTRNEQRMTEHGSVESAALFIVSAFSAFSMSVEARPPSAVERSASRAPAGILSAVSDVNT